MILLPPHLMVQQDGWTKILGILVRTIVEATVTYSHFELGPTSNHALFRSLSDIFGNIVHTLSPSKQQPPVVNSAQDSQKFSHLIPSSISVRRSELSRGMTNTVGVHHLPCDKDIMLLIDQFSITIGVVMPFIDTSNLLSEYSRIQESNRRLPKSMQALINIICAFGSSTFLNKDTEAYYCRAVALLDEQTLRGSSLELSQEIHPI